ncbi:MAG TPA: N-acetylmuramoyl-L-alanine amidase-like domain-containing protein [Nevskiaceae bacterium]|nr:N-acetylmuramoyl-L-alanine amidase-like domain-containing protein [Nevskiaceae bacterium]
MTIRFPPAVRGALAVLALAATLQAHGDPADVGERLAGAASALAAERQPYLERGLGGPQGPEQAGVPSAGLDCVTFMEASLLRAGGVDDRDAQHRWLRTTRYDDREPAYCTRLHYISDWVERNVARGWLGEITAAIAHDRGLTLLRREWSRGWMASQRLDPARCLGSSHERQTLDYIGPADYDRIAADLRTGDILLLVASAPGLDTAHLGIVDVNGGLAMASSLEHRTVVQPDWRAYARKRASRFAGVRVLRVRELPGAPG